MQKPFKSKKVFWKNIYRGMRQGIGQEAMGGRRGWAVKKKASPPGGGLAERMTIVFGVILPLSSMLC